MIAILKKFKADSYCRVDFSDFRGEDKAVGSAPHFLQLSKVIY